RLCFGRSVFFFQADDGIRDFHVTGVQTCALPIWVEVPIYYVIVGVMGRLLDWRLPIDTLNDRFQILVKRISHSLRGRITLATVKIGRASCREREEIELDELAHRGKRQDAAAETLP